MDDDLSMNPKYQVVLKNFHRTPSGAQELRFGTQWFSDVEDVVDSPIVDLDYFSNRLIVVCENGEICTVTDGGVVALLWSGGIAELLPGAPTGWSAGLTQVDFVPFKDELIIHNGVDKPITISSSFVVTYLQDLATGSNVNTPIGKYGCVVADYHVVAGIPASPNELYISSKATSGVFPNDTAPNDSISVDVGAYVPDGGGAILGVAGFKTFLFVFFRNQTLVMELGIYNSDDEHVPDINDTLPHFGILNHRCHIHYDNDLVFADHDGANGARRNLFAGLLDSTHLSDLVQTEYQRTMGALTDAEKPQCFMVLDRFSNSIMVFEPNGRIFVRSASERLKYQSWSEYQGMSWTAGCSSFLGRIFFATGTKIFQLGNKVFSELYRADRLLDRDGSWTLSTAYSVDDLILDEDEELVYKCLVSHTSETSGTFAQDRTANPDNWELYEGEEIEFEMELPWQDAREPMRIKQMRFLSWMTKGNAKFSVKCYVDNLYKDVDGNVIYDPAITLDMIGNDAAGFGTDEDAFGGGRRSMDPRLLGSPLKFKNVKFVVMGSAKNKSLQLIGYSLLYSSGSFKR